MIVHHAGARSALVVTLILLSASADGAVSYAESLTPPLLRADLAFTGANGGRQAGESLPSVRDLTDVSASVVAGGESCTFLLDEALTKQKVMTCEVVLTVAAGRLPDRAARDRKSVV